MDNSARISDPVRSINRVGWEKTPFSVSSRVSRSPIGGKSFVIIEYCQVIRNIVTENSRIKNRRAIKLSLLANACLASED